MASLSLTITSNNVGVITSSYVIDDQDLNRIILALRGKCQEEIDRTDYDRESDKPELTVNYIWNNYAYQVVQSLTNSVVQTEVGQLFRKVQNEILPINIKPGGGV